jgi:hypothetical protein
LLGGTGQIIRFNKLPVSARPWLRRRDGLTL